MPTWQTDEWLENNFYHNNGLPSFFIKGSYSYQNKEVAVQEYKDTVQRATLSNNISYCSWAQGIISANYSVIDNIDVKDFWIRLLDDMTSQQQEANYRELKFDNIYQNNYVANSCISNRKRKNSRAMNFNVNRNASGSSNNQRTRIEFKEIDGLLVSNIDISLASYIGTIARNKVVYDRKSRYFITCGMNGIIDLSDKSEGSQLAEFKDNIDEIRELLPKYTRPINTPPELNEFEAIIMGQVIRHNDSSKYFKKCLDKIKIVKTNDKFEIVKDLYQFVFKLHRFHKYIFSPDYQQLSEQDYVIKVWSPLIEIMFRSFDDTPPIISHWGDTTSEGVKDAGMIIRMDLRLIVSGMSRQNEIIDAAVAEFSPKVFKSKHYKDKLKTVLASKAQLNSLLKNYDYLDEESLKDIAIPFMTIMGLECEIYTLRLAANGLYVVDVIYTMNFPSSDEMKLGGNMKNLIRGLYLVKDLCRDVIETNKKKKANLRKKTKRSQKGLRGDDDKVVRTRLDWSRDLWCPPPYESDSD
ncbi:hypothetical protein RMCBS344292_08483 [Rhizopus microsporus]|nr:hypothetical protein RMCBS344292_08483 [Rhizopus microsporus]